MTGPVPATRMAVDLPGDFDHPAWLTAASTVVAYGLVLLLLFVLLFVLPFLVFTAFSF